MTGDLLADLAAAGGVVLHDPADLFDDRLLGLPIPPEHLALLARSNGLEGYGGWLRLLPVGRPSPIELRRWNHPDLWRDAWADRLDGYLCFAETGWGDQYAYRPEDGDGLVHRLDAFAMEPEPIAGSFDEFLRGHFLPGCRRPADEVTVAARELHGLLPVAEHVVVQGSREDALDPATIVRLPAAAAMRAHARARPLPVSA